MIDFSKRLTRSENVIIREVGDEAVLLNLDTRQYYSLNSSGMRMYQVLLENASLEQGYSNLLFEYAVDPDVLRADLQELVSSLLENGLVEIV
jgi:hypothetical protein